jgi:hypothetical protein
VVASNRAKLKKMMLKATFQGTLVIIFFGILQLLAEEGGATGMPFEYGGSFSYLGNSLRCEASKKVGA